MTSVFGVIESAWQVTGFLVAVESSDILLFRPKANRSLRNAIHWLPIALD
jgi:hypothetical protein